MTINKIAYISVKSYEELFKFLNKENVNYSTYKDGHGEEEIWIEIFPDITINILSKEFLNDEESKKCAEENIEYIIFYEH